MKRSGYTLSLINIILHLLLVTNITTAQQNNAERREIQLLEKDPSTGMVRVKSFSTRDYTPLLKNIEAAQTRFEKALAIHKRINAQQVEMRKLYDAQQKAKKEQHHKQIVQIPKLEKIKFLGKETEFYQGPTLMQSMRSQLTATITTSNVLINGKQVDTIFAGDPFTLTLTLAPNAITAVISIYIDMNKNGVIDSSDLPFITNGLVFDNGDKDLNPVPGEYTMEFPIRNFYSGFLSSLIFEVNNFQTVSSAQLIIKEKPSSKVIVGKIIPNFKNTIIQFYSSHQNNYWFRLAFPDSAGIVTVQFDTTANPFVNVFTGNVVGTPLGYLPLSDTSLTIKKDTTRFSRTFIPAKEFIEGYIKDQHGDPINNAQVDAWWDDYYDDINVNTVTDSAGYYKLGVKSGEWGINFNTPATTDEYLRKGYHYLNMYVGPNQTVRQDFNFVRSNSTISGSVKFNTNGAGGVPVGGSNDSLLNTCFTGVNGGYSLKVWKPAVGNSFYTVSSNIQDYGYYLDTSYRQNILPGATNVNFAIKKVTGGIKGKVTDIKTGLPIKNAGLNFSGPSYRYAYSNDTGYYKISLLDGTYSLNVSANYYEYYYENNINISGSVITKNIALTRSGSFSGTVTDESGTPIANANITARDSLGNYWYSGYSDVQGKYVVSGLQTMPFKATAGANGFVAQWYDKKSVLDSATIFNVTKGFDTPNINFVLSRGGSISGIVKNKNGTTVPNVYIQVYDTLFNGISGTQTDDSGKYVVTGLKTGKFSVVAYSDDYMEQWYNNTTSYHTATKVPVVIDQNTPNINFTLLTGGIIAGKVTDKLGGPIHNAEVVVYDSNYYSMFYTNTNGSGMYEVRKLPVGIKLYLGVYKDQYSRRWYNNVASFAQATPIKLGTEERKDNINITLLLAGKITGRVKNKAGSAIQGANIYAQHINGNSYWANTSSNGTFTISNLQAGKYIVQANHYAYVTQWYNLKTSWQSADTIIVEEEKTASNIDFTLAEGGKITGVVKNTAGEPIPYAYIYANSKNGYGGSGSADNLGSYTISGLATGKYSVRASATDYNEQWYDHRTSGLLADSVSVEFEKTTPNINFDLKAMIIDSVVVKIVVDNLPDSLTFSQSHVGDNYYDYWWGIRFEIFKDSTQPGGNDDFETELAITHAKMPGEAEFNADPVSATQHSLVRWQGNTGYHVRTNVRVWRNLNEKNTLYLAAPKSWWEINNIGSTTKFYGNTIYYGASGQVYDKTSNGTGATTVNDAKGDVAYGVTDLISVGWKKITPLSVDQSTELPLTFTLQQNYPNPFNPSTTIRYALPSTANVKLIVYDLLGREIATLVNEEQSAGWKEVQWNANNVASGMSSKGGYASGVYLMRMATGNFIETKKILLMK